MSEDVKKQEQSEKVELKKIFPMFFSSQDRRNQS